MGLIWEYTEASTEEKFGLALSAAESEYFLQSIGLSKEAPSLSYLRQILRAILGKVPFHNLTLLTRGRQSPTPSEIKSDMLSGLGGPCGHMNPFLGALLERLGFHVHLVAGSMMQPNCHLAVLVRLQEQAYYCDCGDGRPYRDPMPVNQVTEYRHPSHQWRVFPVSGETSQLDVKKEGGAWQRNCTIHLQARPFSFFQTFIYSHYTEDHYGPFQTGFRLVWYPDGKVVGLRDLKFLYQEGDRFCQREITSRKEFFEVAERNFNVPSELVRDAFQELSHRGIKLFSIL